MPDTILQELADLWVALGKPGRRNGAGVLRACAMTLVVFAEEERRRRRASGKRWRALMPEHPSRAILVRLRPGAGRVRSSTACSRSAGCRSGSAEQICCEQIEITASEAAWRISRLVLLPLPRRICRWCCGAAVRGLSVRRRSLPRRSGRTRSSWIRTRRSSKMLAVAGRRRPARGRSRLDAPDALARHDRAVL